MKRQDFLVRGSAVLALAASGCSLSKGKDAELLSKVHVVSTTRFPETSYITGYDGHLLKTTTTALDVRGLGDSTYGYARIRDRIFIPIYGGYAGVDNRIAEFDIKTKSVRFIQCESAPIDVTASDEYLYVAHNDGGTTSTISKIRASDGVTLNKISLSGIASRVFVSSMGVHAFYDRLITPPNADQNIYFLDLNLKFLKTLTHPYSYLCRDIVQRGDYLMIANYQATVGFSGGSSLISLHMPSGSIQALPMPPSHPLQFIEFRNELYLLCESGEIIMIGDHPKKVRKIMQVNGVSAACVEGDVFFCIAGLNDQIYAVDIISRKIISKVTMPPPKYQTGAVLIFPQSA